MNSPVYDTIPLFPLSHGVFPDGMLQLQIFEVRYLDLIKRCHRDQTPFGVTWLKAGSEVQVPGEQPQMHSHGCLAHIREFEQVQPALLRIICQGGLRFQLHEVSPGPFGVWQGKVSYQAQDTPVDIPEQWQEHADRLGAWIATAQKKGLQDRLPLFAPYHLDECGWVANRFAEVLPAETEQKMEWLTQTDPLNRLVSVASFLEDE
jgi:Lon protease-like protein